MSERLRATRLAAAYSLDRMVDDYDDLIRRAYQ
jgi:hypothetical protein